MKEFYYYEYHPQEIAETLCKLAYDKPDKELVKECIKAVYELKAIAENPYNSDYYRTFYSLLEQITNVNLWEE